jgi:Kef-type K+ transport system membrane component KefB
MRTTGLKAVGVGIIGTIGPYVLGFLTCILLMSHPITEEKGWRSAISMGTVLAPTSIAVPLSVFVTYRYVTKPIGQVVLNAAVLDDIFSIILLSILQSLGDSGKSKGEMVLHLCLKLLYNIIMIVSAGVLGRYVMPRWGLDVFHFLSDRLGDDRRDMIQVTCVFSMTILLSYLASLFHCDLLGPFCAGLIFCELPRSETLLHHQTKVMVRWMIRIFFTFGVGCGVPARNLFLWEAFWKGVVIFIVPAFAGKLLCGVFHRKDFLMTGMAMSGRGSSLSCV